MRALTIRQPWSWAIFHGKNVENRKQAFNYIGPLMIHAGLQLDDDFSGAVALIERLTNESVPALGSPRSPVEAELGAVVGVVDLVGVHRSYECGCTDTQTGCSPWAQPFQAHLQLRNPRLLSRPVPASGRQGLWVPDEDLITAVRKALA